ncbi:MAG: thioredoxin family protein [Desulfobacteraceae bacterium]|nr:MAG: thioredoxin family protein [Desulfobacteraceae bacterium]
MDIKILGRGCAKCQATEKNVREAVAESGVDVKVEKVANLLDIANFGVLRTPAVVIDGEVKCVGEIPSKEEVKKWIEKHQNSDIPRSALGNRGRRTPKKRGRLYLLSERRHPTP